MNHAQRTLGIKEPTTGQKILSGIIRAVKNLIPIVGSLIPDKVVVDLFVKILAPLFGIQPNKFLAEQQEAQDELAAYNEEYGTDLLRKLRGMFAFVIWDSENKTLFGARDYFGIKPFYYSLIDDVLVFSSETKNIIPRRTHTAPQYMIGY